MAATTGIIGYGTTIGYATTSGGSYTLLAEVTKIAEPDVAVNPIKMTHLTSPNTTHEYIPGMIEPGELKLEVNFTKAQRAIYFTQLRVVQFFKITTIDGSTTIYPGFIMGFGGEIPTDDGVKGTLMMKVTGIPVFTAGS